MINCDKKKFSVSCEYNVKMFVNFFLYLNIACSETRTALVNESCGCISLKLLKHIFKSKRYSLSKARIEFAFDFKNTFLYEINEVLRDI